MKSVPQQYSQTIIEVRSLPEYQRCVASKSGYFQITDSANPNMIHPVDCVHCRGINGEEHFKEKVVDNKRKNGQYFYSKSLPDLKNWLGADICGG